MINRVSIVAVALTVAFGSADLAVAQQSSGTPKAQPIAKAAPAPKISAPGTLKAVPQARPLVVTVDLHSNTKLAGTLTDASNLEVQTSFGPADLPLSEVAGIRFATADDPSTTIILHNGDSLTGATNVQIVTVETEWGTATINGQSVKSILFVPNVSWNALAGLSGKRWSLTSTKKPVAKQPAPTPVTYPSRSRSYRTR